MTVAFGSISTKNVANGANSPDLTITKPSGLSEGDLMVAFCSTVESRNAYTASGWTNVVTRSDADFVGSNDGVLSCLAKIADSSDVAASDFTFSQTGGDGGMGSLLRITSSEDGFDIASLIVNDADFDSGGDTTFTGSGGVTPANVNSILLFCTSQEESNGTGGYAIATDNPTWSERTDRQNTGNVIHSQAVATASRPEATATGDYTATTANVACFGIILAVNEKKDVTVSPAVIQKTASVQAPSVSAAANVSPAVIQKTASIQAPTVTGDTGDWSNKSKSSAPSWTNKQKS